MYRAWCPASKRHVAVKQLHIPLPLDEQDSHAAGIRFQQEIRALGRVRRPNLAKIHTSGVTTEGRLFYSMDLIHGANLSEIYEALVARLSHQDQRWSWHHAVLEACAAANGSDIISDSNPGRRMDEYAHTVVGIVRQVCLAVQCLHDAGIVHRDIKPANIMVSSSGDHATLMDLGLANVRDHQETRLTRTGLIAGTLPYISPEQFLGTQPSESGDIYNLGVILWELLALERLFARDGNASEAQLMNRTLLEEPPSLCNQQLHISPDLDAVVQKCLEKQAKRRYQTVAELIDDLDRCIEGLKVAARKIRRKNESLTWLWTLRERHRAGSGVRKRRSGRATDTAFRNSSGLPPRPCSLLQLLFPYGTRRSSTTGLLEQMPRSEDRRASA